MPDGEKIRAALDAITEEHGKGTGDEERELDALRAERDSLRDQRDALNNLLDATQDRLAAAEARVEAPTEALRDLLTEFDEDAGMSVSIHTMARARAALAAARPGEFRCEPDESAGLADGP